MQDLSPSQLSPADYGLHEGARIGNRFRLVRQLRNESAVQSWQAADEKSHKDVALHVISIQARDEALLENLRNKCALAARLTHPNVPAVLGFGRLPSGQAYVATQLSDGRSLDVLVNDPAFGNGQLPVRIAYNILSRVCDALHALHRVSPHGALRPRAIWISDAETVRIADFPIAGFIAEVSGGAKVQANDPSSAFLAPEVQRGEPASIQSDIYSAGALLYYMVTGHVPSEGNSGLLPNDAPAGLQSIISKAMSLDSSARYATAEELFVALQSMMGRPSSRPAPRARINSLEISVASLIPSAAPGPTVEKGLLTLQASMFELQDARDRLKNDQATRWMIIKDQMDHGPFRGEEIADQILNGEFHKKDLAQNLSTGEVQALGKSRYFSPFVDYKSIKDIESHEAVAHHKANRRDSHSRVMTATLVAVGIGIVGLGGYAYMQSRGSGGFVARALSSLTGIYDFKNIRLRGGVQGAPPKVASGPRRSGARPSGAGGNFSTYEDAMSQTIDLGDAAEGGGEAQLSNREVANAIDQYLNSISARCVIPELKSGANLQHVTVDVAIGGGGSVLGVSIREGSSAFRTCVAGQINAIRFPSFEAPRMAARYRFTVN